jgi:hypothetical protein
MTRRTTALMVLVALALTGCSSSGDPSATYTGAACHYDGPSEFDMNSTVTFSVTNETDTTSIGFAVLKFPEGSTAEDVSNEGIFSVVAGDARLEPYVPSPTVIDREYEMTVTFNEVGQHGINCFDFAGAGLPGWDYVTMFTVVE